MKLSTSFKKHVRYPHKLNSITLISTKLIIPQSNIFNNCKLKLDIVEDLKLHREYNKKDFMILYLGVDEAKLPIIFLFYTLLTQLYDRTPYNFALYI